MSVTISPHDYIRFGERRGDFDRWMEANELPEKTTITQLTVDGEEITCVTYDLNEDGKKFLDPADRTRAKQSTRTYPLRVPLPDFVSTRGVVV